MSKKATIIKIPKYGEKKPKKRLSRRIPVLQRLKNSEIAKVILIIVILFPILRPYETSIFEFFKPVADIQPKKNYKLHGFINQQKSSPLKDSPEDQDGELLAKLQVDTINDDEDEDNTENIAELLFKKSAGKKLGKDEIMKFKEDTASKKQKSLELKDFTVGMECKAYKKFVFVRNQRAGSNSISNILLQGGLIFWFEFFWVCLEKHFKYL